MKRSTAVAFLVLAALLSSGARLAFAQGGAEWHRPFPAFKIAGNLYYVGTADLAAYLIATPQGHILLNANFIADLPLLKKNIEQLGFEYKDIKVVLISHAHWDHDEAVGVVRKETGAKLMVMDADAADVQSAAPGRPGAQVDRVLHDGDRVELGGSTLVARLTAGHTRGCTSWTMRVQDEGRALDAVFLCSVNANGAALVDNPDYPQIADDFIAGLNTLKSLPCDLFLASHGSFFGLKAKYAQLKPGAANPFIDPDGYRAYVADRRTRFMKDLDRQERDADSR